MTRATTPVSSRAPSVLPQVGQKARLDPLEERHVAGGPPGPVQSTCPGGNSAQHRVSAPECRWHIRQEQVWGHPAWPVARNRMCPHRHPPSYPVTAIRHRPFQCLSKRHLCADLCRSSALRAISCRADRKNSCRPCLQNAKSSRAGTVPAFRGVPVPCADARQQAESDAPRLDL